METNNIFDGAFDRMIEDEAWQRLSSSYPFSAELLEQYKDSYFYNNMVDIKVKEMEQMLCRQ